MAVPNPAPQTSFGRIPLVFWVFVTVFLVRLVCLNLFAASPYFLPESGDEKFYHDWALRILDGKADTQGAFYGLPGYAYLLAAIYSVTGIAPYAVALLQIAGDAGLAVLIFITAKKSCSIPESTPTSGFLAPETISALAAAIAWLLFVPAQTYSIVLMPTTLAAFFFWLGVWSLVRSNSRTPIALWAGLGIATGLVTTMVATVLALVPLAFVRVLTLAGYSLKQRVLACLLVSAGVGAGTSPCWIHNYFVAGEPVFLSAHSGLNFYVGNNPKANGYPQIPSGLRASQEDMLADSITLAEQSAGHSLMKSEVSAFWSDRAQAWISNNRAAWLQLMATKAANYWNAFSYDDIVLISLFQAERLILPGLGFGILSLLGLPGLIIGLVRSCKQMWLPAAATLLQMAMVLPVFVTERYRLAAVPGLCIGAAFLAIITYRAVRSRQFGRLVLPSMAVVACAPLVFWPRDTAAFDATRAYNLGHQLSLAGKHDRALPYLEDALARTPRSAPTHFALANLWFHKGDTTKAKNHYRQTVEIGGPHSGAFRNLGVIAMQENRLPLAEQFLEFSIAAEPNDAVSHYLLARVRLLAGNRKQAASSVHKALTLEPERREFLELASEIGFQEE